MCQSDVIKENCRQFIHQQLKKDKLSFVMYLANPKFLFFRKMMIEGRYKGGYIEAATELEGSSAYSTKQKIHAMIEDFLFFRRYGKPNEFLVGEAEIAIVAIVRNEADYIEEWLDYYKEQGYDRVYLFDNRSTDDIRTRVKSYVENGFVSYINFEGEKAQMPAYRFAIRKIKKHTKWVAFIDADEFMYTTQGSIKEFLNDYVDYPGLVVNWRVYGHCGIEEKPVGGVIGNYLYTFEDVNNELNLRVKTIANPKEIKTMTSPHFCYYKHCRNAVNENKVEIDGSNMLVSGSGRAITKVNSTKKIRINHYWTRSINELRQKCKRGYAAGKNEPVFEQIMRRLEFPLVLDDELAERVKRNV